MSTAKRNEVAPPYFRATTGEAVIHYDDHDGRAVIGEGAEQFETKWGRSSGTDIIAYNDPPSIRGVALAPNGAQLEDITAASAAALNFTSRTRRPDEGQVVVFENIYGCLLAVQVLDVLAAGGHGDPEDRLSIRYVVVPTDNDSQARAAIVRMTCDIEEELRRLQVNEATPPKTVGGIGHNNPPEPTPLTASEYSDTIDILQKVRVEVQRETPDPSAIATYLRKFGEVTAQITKWVLRKLDLLADEFAKQSGKSLGSEKLWIAAWLGVTGKLDGLIAFASSWQVP